MGADPLLGARVVPAAGAGGGASGTAGAARIGPLAAKTRLLTGGGVPGAAYGAGGASAAPGARSAGGNDGAGTMDRMGADVAAGVGLANGCDLPHHPIDSPARRALAKPAASHGHDRRGAAGWAMAAETVPLSSPGTLPCCRWALAFWRASRM